MPAQPVLSRSMLWRKKKRSTSFAYLSAVKLLGVAGKLTLTHFDSRSLKYCTLGLPTRSRHHFYLILLRLPAGVLIDPFRCRTGFRLKSRRYPIRDTQSHQSILTWKRTLTASQWRTVKSQFLLNVVKDPLAYMALTPLSATGL